GDTFELADRLAKEGSSTTADVFLSEDGGALGRLAKADLLARIPQDTLDEVEARFRSRSGLWVGISARARTIAFNTNALSDTQVPDNVFAFADGLWKGRVALTPSHPTFQSFVTAMRVNNGEDRTEQWLRSMKANGPKIFDKPDEAVAAVARGEVDLALANHWNAHEVEQSSGYGYGRVANHFTRGGDPGGFVNVSGVAILKTSRVPEHGARFARMLLSGQAQQRFADVAYEYPLAPGAKAPRDP